MNYSDYANGDTIIARYMTMMAAQETPHAYDFWCAVWAIGVVVGRRLTIARPRAPVHLNNYLVLVGDSGILRKSTAVNSITRVIRRCIEETDDHTVVIDGRITTSQLVREMIALNNGGYDASVALSISELAATLGRGGGAHDMPILLTDLYDAPSVRRGGSRSEGQYTVRNAFVSLIGASTPAWLVRAVNPSVVEGGFTSRCLFVTADKRKRRIAWPDDTSTDDEVDRVVSVLRHRRELLRGVADIKLTRNARESFARWYNSRRLGHDVFRSSFDSRADAHTLRVAGILAISDGTCVVHSRHIEQSCALVQRVREDGARLFAGVDEDRLDPLVRVFDKLRTILVNAGREGISQGRLVLAMAHYADADGCVRILNAMHELDMVHRAVLNPSSRGGRPKTVWRGTRLLYGKHGVELARLLSAPTSVLAEDHQSGMDDQSSD